MASLADVHRPYGSTTRPLHLARVLADLGAEILHVCKQGPADGDGIEWLHTGAADPAHDAGMRAAIASRCRAFAADVFYVHQVYDSSLQIAGLAATLGTALVYDPHGSPAMEAPTFHDIDPKRLQQTIEAERTLARQAVRTLAPSRKLRDFIAATHDVDPARIEVVPNGVDTSRFRPAPPDRSLPATVGIPREARLIAMTCPRLHTFPTNAMALQRLFSMVPGILEAIPDAWIVVLGGGPMPQAPSPRVRYAGFVEDLPAWLNAADVCVAPFPRAAVCGGTRNKIAEYLACGKPLVSTSEGMCGFDDVTPGEGCLLADDADDFVAAVAAVCRDCELAAHLGANARRMSLNYDWRELGKRVHGVLRSACASSHKHGDAQRDRHQRRNLHA